MELLQFKKEYKVNAYEIGPDGKLSLSSLLDFLQDIAGEHATVLGFGRDDLLKDNRFWVLSRMLATISDWPEWGQTIVVSTWPRGTEKIFALRDFEIHFPDGRQIASASSSWLVVDKTTKRVQRPDVLLTQYNSMIPVRNAPGRNAGKLEPMLEESRKGEIFKVNISDLDVNLHTNNVKYVKWVTDSYNLDFIMSHLPVSLEINYLAESRWNEEIFIITSSEENNGCIYNHSVFRNVDKNELCRLRIEWKACDH